jgi:hypothetical protein
MLAVERERLTQSPDRIAMVARMKGKKVYAEKGSDESVAENAQAEHLAVSGGHGAATGKTTESKAERDMHMKGERKRAFEQTWREMREAVKNLQPDETPHQELPVLLQHMIDPKIIVKNNQSTWGCAGVDKGMRLTIVGVCRPAD